MSAENWVIVSELYIQSIGTAPALLDVLKAIMPSQFWNGTEWVMNEAQKAKRFPSKEAADIEATAAALLLSKNWLIRVVGEAALPVPPAIDIKEAT